MQALAATNITLNDDQNRVLDNLQKWSLTDKLWATLSGSAGTGKSTLLQFFINGGRFRKGEIAVTAPTHKAKKVITNITGLTGKTIQSLLGLRPNTELDNFNYNKPQFDPLADKTICDYKLVIIDEASMVNKDLLRMLKEEAQYYNVKLLFVGDELQLPPINEEKSEVFTDPDIDVERLTVVVRQAHENPLKRLLIALREDIANGTDHFRVILAAEPCIWNEDGSEGYETMKSERFFETILADFRSQAFIEDKTHCKFTAWTNNSIGKWNKGIRDNLNGKDSYLTAGDLLMSYQTVMNNQNELLLTNSEEYIVAKVVEHKRTVPKSGGTIDLKGCFINLKDISGQVATNNLFIVEPNNYKGYLEKFNELLANATTYKGRAWKPFYEFKQENMLITDIRNERKLVAGKTLDYGYGVTVHKTQGSTYNHIYVNGIDIDRNPDLTERRKLWYVALSRARHKAYILQ